jgi:hypothetical protein
MAARLSRKRPSPLSHGRIEIWACAIVYAVGRINFLFDKAVTPHMKPDELCGAFDVKQSTVSGKAGKILDMLDAIVLDPDGPYPASWTPTRWPGTYRSMGSLSMPARLHWRCRRRRIVWA